MRKKLLIPVVVLLAAGGVFAFRTIRSAMQDDAGTLRISGNIEVTDVEVSFKIPGRVERRAVSEGEIVKAGDLAAQLDRTELDQEVAIRRAEVSAAEAALAELVAGSRPEEIGQAEAAVREAQARLDELLAGSRSEEIAAQQAATQRARADVERLKSDLDRQTTLYKADVISAREFEGAQTAYQVAQARLREEIERLKLVKEGPRQEEIARARAALAQTRERAALVNKGPRRETIDQARARVEQTRQALAVAETRLAYSTVSSPISGVVLSENVEPGMYVAPGTPVVTVGDLNDVWMRGYIGETELGRVKPGQLVQVTTDTYPGKRYEGRVSFIASQAEFTPKSVQTDKERVKLVYRVKIDIRNPGMELKPGMPADAEIILDATNPQSGHLAPATHRTHAPAIAANDREAARNRALNELLSPDVRLSAPATKKSTGTRPEILLAREVRDGSR